MDTTWIIVADAGRARIFVESNLSLPLQEIEDMLNPAIGTSPGGQKKKSLRKVTMGKRTSKADTTTKGKPVAPTQSMEDYLAESFVRYISGFLMMSLQEKRFEKLTLLAEPKFLGALHLYLDPQLQPLIKQVAGDGQTPPDGGQLHSGLVQDDRLPAAT